MPFFASTARRSQQRGSHSLPFGEGWGGVIKSSQEVGDAKRKAKAKDCHEDSKTQRKSKAKHLKSGSQGTQSKLQGQSGSLHPRHRCLLHNTLSHTPSYRAKQNVLLKQDKLGTVKSTGRRRGDFYKAAFRPPFAFLKVGIRFTGLN